MEKEKRNRLETHHIFEGFFWMEIFFAAFEGERSMLWSSNLEISLRKARRKVLPIFGFLKIFFSL